MNDDYNPKTITWSIDSQVMERRDGSTPDVPRASHAVIEHTWMRIARGRGPVEYTPVTGSGPRSYHEFPVYEESDIQRWSRPRR